MAIQTGKLVKYGGVARKVKDRRSVVFCGPKDYEATGVALLSEKHSFVLNANVKKRKSAPMLCERCLIPDTM